MPIVNKDRSFRKQKIGFVVSDKNDKTIVVKIGRTTKHPLYGKVIRKYSKFKVHDPENKAKVDDKVRIIECRPLSKEKRWRLVEIIK